MLRTRIGTLTVLGLSLALTAPVAAAGPTWSAATAEAVREYQKQVSAALAPLYADWQQLAERAAQAPGGPPGTMMPPAPVEALETYRSLFTLAALPDKWRLALMSDAAKARDQGSKAKAVSKPPEQPHNRFQADFAGKPRGLAFPRVPSPRGEVKGDLPVAPALAALDEASSGDAQAFRAYQKAADRLAEAVQAKVHTRVRDHVLKLRLKLAKLVPADPPDWKHLPDELGQPVAYYLASAYYEGHGGIVGASSATGTGDGGQAAAVPSEGGTGSGDSKEAGPAGTGAGDAAGEPSDSGTGAGKTTPKAFKDRPGTGAGKSDPKAAPKGTGN
ncbi:MAG: hypothetical protein HYY25_15365 [Candidatus Wallbacteria bacterium]|nr:hypothetical protein [Candidatus Wallbacteria bacterium]